MNVRELVEKLSSCNPDAMVVVNGYEGGFDDIEVVETIELAMDVYEQVDYLGPHELANVVKSHDVMKSSFGGSELDDFVKEKGIGTLDCQAAVYIGKRKRRA